MYESILYEFQGLSLNYFLYQHIDKTDEKIAPKLYLVLCGEGVLKLRKMHVISYCLLNRQIDMY